jgi:PilZ domain
MPTPMRSQASIQSSRLYARRPLDLRVQLLARPDASGQVIVIHGRTVDLSRRGAGLTLAGELAAGTEVVLCLRPPGWKNALCLQAVIIRRRGFRVGVEFVRTTAEQSLLLGELCYA